MNRSGDRRFAAQGQAELLAPVSATGCACPGDLPQFRELWMKSRRLNGLA
jgi:hypothetical protein